MKTLILGLDGVPRKLVERLGETGVMPRMAAVAREGSLTDLAASIPEISSVSWSSFMTGANPGVHGIFGFTDLVPGSRKLRFPRFADLAVPTLWDRLGALGRRSVVINQPATYPARPIPGAIVSGFVALDLDRAVHPARHVRKLRELGYTLDVDMRRGRTDAEALFCDLHASLAAGEQAVCYFRDAEPWDVFEFVVTGTDRLQHVLWDAVEEPDHLYHERVLGYYHAVDSTVGRIVDEFRDAEPSGAFFILSDHGFTRCRHEVRINAWLEEKGYLSTRDADRSSLECLAETTRAFALDPGRIYLVGADRDAHAEEIASELRRVTLDGKPVFRAVHRREDIYSGPETHRAPDLVVQGLDGFDLKGTLKGGGVFGPPVFTGMHNPDAFLLTNRPVGRRLEIESLAHMIEGPYE